LSAVQALQTQIQHISAASSLNQQITASIQTAIQTQSTAVTTQLNNLQQTELGDAATQIANLKQQAQMQYHIIQMNMGNSTSAGSILTSLQTLANLSAVQPGTTLGILAGTTTGELSLPIANVNVTSPSTSASSSSSSDSSASSSSSGSSSLGSIVSTSA